MALNVLTDDFRKQLEQQHKRLVKDRDAIVQAAIAHATISIDASLDHISSLLGELQTQGNTPAATATGKPRGRRPKQAVEATQETSIEKPKRGRRPNPVVELETTPKGRKTKARVIDKPAKSAKASKAKTKAPKAAKPALDLAPLKPEFAGLTPTQAIAKVLKRNPQKAYDVDQMISEIYGTVDPVVAARTRQRVGVMFGHGARRNEFEKVQDNPPLYKLGRG